MANFSVLCICVYFVFYIRISTSSVSNGHYFYETLSEPEAYTHVALKLQGGAGESHHLQRRQTMENRPPSSIQSPIIKNDTSSEINKTTRFNDSKQTSAIPATLPKVNLTRTSSTLPEEVLPSNPTKVNVKLTSPPQPLPPQVPSFQPNVTVKNKPLLGANGTGQRKVFPYTKPAVISSTLPPLLHDIAKNTSGKPDFDDFIDKISISKFTDKELNATLAQHNITNETIKENYGYYNSTFLTDIKVAEHYWVNLSEIENCTTHELLSSAHRRAATVTLSFDFPFYGHLIKNVTIATGGFLYTGDYVHAWLAATQYIAPLMANFDTSLSNDSFVRFADNGTSFTVLWEKVALKDRASEGDFTFQTTLHKNGDIVFVYQTVPTIIENIKDDQHPVKIGLSDAYIIDSTLFFLRRKTIYEYHRVNFQKEEIKNGTVIILKALPTCLDETDCDSCLKKELSSFQCVWCPGLNKCSSGVDRNRQAWIMRGCDHSKIKNISQCSIASHYHVVEKGKSVYEHDLNDLDIVANASDVTSSSFKQSEIIGAKESSKMGISGVLAIMILISMIVGITMWVFYAYRNPHTTSGQMLIRYRPSQWTWKRGEARYTAATIHM